VFRSTNVVNAWQPTWESVNNGLENKYVGSLLVADSSLFAGTSAGVFLSTNMGASWNAVSIGLQIPVQVGSLAHSGTNLFAGSWSGVFRSTNDGAEWTPMNSGLSDLHINDLIAHDTDLFAGTNGSGVFLSTNYGTNWSDIGLTGHMTTAFAISDTTLLVGTHQNGPLPQTETGYLFRYDNQESGWAEIDAGLSKHMVYSILPLDTILLAGTFAHGISYSTDNGTSWSDLNTGFTDLTVFSLIRVGASLFAGTGGQGVLLSKDNGVSWSAVNFGLTTMPVYTFALSGSKLFAGTAVGVFLSMNSGARWTQMTEGLPFTPVFALDVFGDNLYVGTERGVWHRSLQEMVVSVDEKKIERRAGFFLSQNYPNPFNPTTRFTFSLPSRTFASLKIFDMMGREVATIVSEELPPGHHSYEWNAATKPSGIYFYRLLAGSHMTTRKLLLIK